MTVTEELLNFLRDGGQAGPTSAEAIMNHFGWSRRRLYKEVADARTDGYLILTDGRGGYFLGDPGTPEGRTALRAFSKRAASAAIALFTVSQTARKLVKGFDNEQ